MKAINKNTSITIGVLISVLGGAGWLTDLKFQGNANASAIKEAQLDQREYRETLTHILKWLSAIGQKLNVPEPRK